jgi:hypothetical protein
MLIGAMGVGKFPAREARWFVWAGNQKTGGEGLVMRKGMTVVRAHAALAVCLVLAALAVTGGGVPVIQRGGPLQPVRGCAVLERAPPARRGGGLVGVADSRGRCCGNRAHPHPLESEDDGSRNS